MTGVHALTGHWFVPCDAPLAYVPCDGLPFATPVEWETIEIVVTFEAS